MFGNSFSRVWSKSMTEHRLQCDHLLFQPPYYQGSAIFEYWEDGMGNIFVNLKAKRPAPGKYHITPDTLIEIGKDFKGLFWADNCSVTWHNSDGEYEAEVIGEGPILMSQQNGMHLYHCRLEFEQKAVERKENWEAKQIEDAIELLERLSPGSLS